MDDQQAFAAVKCLVGARRFSVGVNLARANTPGMPGFRGYENSLAMWGSIGAVVVFFIRYGWPFGLLSVPLSIVVFMISGRVVQKRAGSRTRRWALSSASRLRAMWEADVVSVRDTQSGQTAIAMRGDDLNVFVHAAVRSILATEDDPIAKDLKVALAACAA